MAMIKALTHTMQDYRSLHDDFEVELELLYNLLEIREKNEDGTVGRIVSVCYENGDLSVDCYDGTTGSPMTVTIGKHGINIHYPKRKI